MKEKYVVEGMTCAACQSHVDKAVRKIDGVESVNVNLLTKKMEVEYDNNKTSSVDIINQVIKAGYNAYKENEKADNNSNKKDSSLRTRKKKLIFSFFFLILLLYISMGEMINLPLPNFLSGHEGAFNYAFTQFLLLIPILYLNKNYFTNGFKRLFKGSPNMDSLIALASSVATLYGVFAIYMINFGFVTDNMEIVSQYHMDLYFESAGTILTLVSLGKFLEAKSTLKTKDAITSLVKLAPSTAIILKDDKEISTLVENVKIDDIFVVKPGETIPVDGVIIDGYSSIDEANITGESIPVYKKVGDTVTSSTININGSFKAKAIRVGKDTTINTIIRLVEEASNSKAPISRLADKISLVFVPVVLIISLITLITWFIITKDISFSLTLAISVLVIACPCALGLATPVAIMVGIGKGAKSGLLIKSAEHLEIAHKIKTIVLDKTGTITNGKPVVTDIKVYNNWTTENLLKIAFAIESNSSHPLASSIIDYVKDLNIKKEEIEDFLNIPGLGVKGKINGTVYYSGNLSLVKQTIKDTTIIESDLHHLTSSAKTPLIFFTDEKIIGIIAVRDEVKKSSKDAISYLKKMNLNVVMLTGDNKNTASTIAKEIGIDNVISDVLPSNKKDAITSLKESTSSPVCMVGDGVNDALALMESDLGIAIGAGTSVALDTADVILVRNDLIDVVNFLNLSKKTTKIIKMGLFWAFFYNAIGIILATGAFYYSFNIKLNPMIASLAMSLSSVSVVLNALRINLFKPIENINNIKERKDIMKKAVITIEGMMCNNCVKHVNAALEALSDVSDVQVSLENKQASFNYQNDETIDNAVSAITNAGYQVVKTN